MSVFKHDKLVYSMPIFFRKLESLSVLSLGVLAVAGAIAQDSATGVKPVSNTVAYEEKISADVLPARIETGQKVDGLLEGQIVLKTVGGLTIGTMEFVKGKLHGESVTYYPNGKKYQVDHFENGVLQGKRMMYWKNGKLFFEGDFKKGLAEGTLRTFHDNGEIATIAQAKNGLFQGERFHFTRRGIQFGITLWEDGVEIEQRQTGPLDEREADEMTRRMVFPDVASVWAGKK